MTIKNISSKIISIGTIALMPDQTMEATEQVCNTPAVKAMKKRGQLSIIKNKPAKAEDKATPKAEDKK